MECDILYQRIHRNRRDMEPSPKKLKTWHHFDPVPMYFVAPIPEDMISASAFEKVMKKLKTRVPWSSSKLTGINLEVRTSHLFMHIHVVYVACNEVFCMSSI